MAHSADEQTTISVKPVNYKATIEKDHKGSPNDDIHPFRANAQNTATVKTHRRDDFDTATIQDDAANDSTVTTFGAPSVLGAAGAVVGAVSIDGDGVADGIFAVAVAGSTVTVSIDDNTNLAVGTYDLTVTMEYMVSGQYTHWQESSNYVPRPDVVAFRQQKIRVTVEAA
jgi:hypothetical protein